VGMKDQITIGLCLAGLVAWTILIVYVALAAEEIWKMI